MLQNHLESLTNKQTIRVNAQTIQTSKSGWGPVRAVFSHDGTIVVLACGTNLVVGDFVSLADEDKWEVRSWHTDPVTNLTMSPTDTGFVSCSCNELLFGDLSRPEPVGNIRLLGATQPG